MSDQPTPPDSQRAEESRDNAPEAAQPAQEQPLHDDRTAKPVTRRRRWWSLLLGIALIVAAGSHYFFTGYGPHGQLPSGREPDPIEIPSDFREADALPAKGGDFAGFNVLLVTLDTTRADRIGCYGNKTIQTPTLDMLAREGVVFSTATAVSPTTLPSHASILTGLYPEHHGAVVNGLYRLQDEQRTLAETLRDGGYQTGAVISASVLSGDCGTAQGFATYDDDLSEGERPSPFMYVERRAGRTTDRAVNWVKDAAAGPFFLWVHYWDPHATYEPPSPYAEQYESFAYDGEIAYVDAELGRLIRTLDDLGLTERTLVIVVGDHGDSLGQHLELTHAFLTYEATLRVPLIMRCGARLGGGVHIKHRVSQVDIVPTVHSLLGLAPPEQTDGVDLTAGAPPSRPIFSETRHGLVLFGWAGLLAVHEGADKYIHSPKPELYDLSEDRNEQHNVIESRPERAEALRQELVRVFPDVDMSEVSAPTRELSLAQIEQLQSLGYAAVPANPTDPSERPNPRDMMPAMLKVEQIMFTKDFNKDLPKRIQQLEEVIAQFPDFHPAFRYLADLCRMSGSPTKSIEYYTRCLAICRDPTTLFGLALAHLQLKQFDEAEQYLQEIVDRFDDHLNARFFLGMLAGQAEEFDTAIQHFRRVVERDPDFVSTGMQPAAQQLVMAYFQARRGDEVHDVIERLLKAHPNSPQLRAGMALVYARERKFEEAEDMLREGVRMAPGNPGAVANLAVFLVGCPDPVVRKPLEGVTMMERVCENTGYRDPQLLTSLSMLYALMGRFDEAITVGEKVKALALENGNPGLLQGADQLLQQCRAAKASGASPERSMLPGAQWSR